MWVVSQSKELVQITEARWIDCVPAYLGSEVGGPPEWRVRVFFLGKERGAAEHILFRGLEAEAQAVFHGLKMLTGAYRLNTVQGYGAAAGAGDDTSLEGGRVIPLEEPVLRGVRDII